jgi:replicative DNA helicase
MTEPYSVEAEQSILGAMLIDPVESIPLVIGTISESDFYFLENSKTFSAMVDMHNQGKPIDMVTLDERLKGEGIGVENVRVYLLQLAQMVPSLVNTKAYAEIVKAKSQKRRVTGKLQEAIYRDMDADALIPAVEKIVEDERAGSSTKNIEEDQKQTLVSYSEEIFKPLDRSSRIWTGYGKIDQKLCGLLKKCMSYVGAPPSTGKTTFAVNVAGRQIEKTKNRVAFFGSA